MDIKIFAVASVALMVGVIAMSNLAQPVMAEQEKCLTWVNKDTGQSTGRSCGSNEEANDAKRFCKENTDNKETGCSSSQTGNGDFGND